MPMTATPRNPKNAPGPFYVVKDQCLSCGAPEAEAPTLMGSCADAEGCYFRKQSETPEEVYQAISAMQVSCIEVLRYGGQDPAILKRLAELGASLLCDYPETGHAEIKRNHVRFAMGASGAHALSQRLLEHFRACFARHDSASRNFIGDETRASFEFSWSTERGRFLRYEVSRFYSGE